MWHSEKCTHIGRFIPYYCMCSSICVMDFPSESDLKQSLPALFPLNEVKTIREQIYCAEDIELDEDLACPLCGLIPISEEEEELYD